MDEEILEELKTLNETMGRNTFYTGLSALAGIVAIAIAILAVVIGLH